MSVCLKPIVPFYPDVISNVDRCASTGIRVSESRFGLTKPASTREIKIATCERDETKSLNLLRESTRVDDMEVLRGRKRVGNDVSEIYSPLALPRWRVAWGWCRDSLLT